MFPLAGDKMKKEKNKWKTIFWIMLVINILMISNQLYIFYTLNHQESHTAKSREEICASDNVINCSVCVNGEMSCNYIDSAGYADPEKYLTCPCGGSNEE